MPENYHILIVDDDDEHAEWITEFLRISGPFTADRGKAVAELWQQLAAHRYDAVLLDYKLPDGTGLDALAEIPQRGYNLPVIMITGQGDERIAVKAMQVGAADYMVKGAESLLTLPTIIKKAIQAHQLHLSMQRSLEQIRYQALLLNNVRDAIVVWDTAGKITYWNPAAEMLFGLKASEQLGHPVADAYLNLFTPPVRIPPREGTTGQEVERSYTSVQGKSLWVSSRVGVLRDYETGRLLGNMDISRDITARKKTEQELRIAQLRVTQAARLAAIGELASGVAHHINNPLTAIIGEAHLLLQTIPAGHPARESAETIEQAGWRVQQAVQRLLDFSRPDAATLTDLSINETIQNAIALVGDHIRAGGIRIEYNLAPQLPPIRGSQRQMDDLWVNLLLLGRDAAADGQPHTIHIRTSAAGGKILVEIADNGKVIPSADLERIFDPDFLQPLGGRGTGIEMSICQEIIRQHSGSLQAESQPGHGTIFRITLGGVS